MSDFGAQVAKFAEKAKGEVDRKVRGVTVTLFRDVIMSSPVGNPELWAANKISVEYNAEVAAHNSALRNDPGNLDKRGRLKRGRKLKDGMDVKAPKGYVGGRFRGNWQTSVGQAVTFSVDRIDPTGAQASAEVVATVPATAGNVVYLTNNLIYGPRLEYEGWSKQAPAGMVRVNMARIGAIMAETK